MISDKDVSILQTVENKIRMLREHRDVIKDTDARAMISTVKFDLNDLDFTKTGFEHKRRN